MLDKILPNWVEPDPLRSRAVDALGLQAVADRLADRLLPGLSVLTTRARYFTFLCWARQKTGSDLNERAIHRFEVALAITEHELHGLAENPDDGDNSCSFVGSRNIKGLYDSLKDSNLSRLDPRSVYTTPAWRQYRPALVNLGLIEDNSRFSLSRAGEEAAKAFWKKVRYKGPAIRRLPRSACLSEIYASKEERRILKNCLGLSVRRIPEDAQNPQYTRARFARLPIVRRLVNDRGLYPERVLPQFESERCARAHEPVSILHAAAIWEYLSLGLNMIFTAWVRAIAIKQHRSYLQLVTEAMKAKSASPSLETEVLDDSKWESIVRRGRTCLRYACHLAERLLPARRALLEDDAFHLARIMLQASRRNLAEEALSQLLQRHFKAKGGEAWVLCPRDDLGRATINQETKRSWRLPNRVRLHPYRMEAFCQIVLDLGGL